MASRVTQRKRFAEHSARWQREAKRDGISPKRWDAWLKLSDKSRRESDPRRYAKGESVAAQRMDTKREQAATKILQAFAVDARVSTVRRGVQGMSNAELNAVLKRSGIKLKDFVRTKARVSVPGKLNPFWYR